MLEEHNPSGDALLQKYDNSSILPVDAARQVDYSVNPPAELVDNDDNTGHDRDDTIVLQQEIEDTIGKTTDDQNANTSSLNKPQRVSDLPVETTENNVTLDTSSITKGLSNLTVSQSSTTQTPLSPNRGTVVFKSYRLCCCAANTNNETRNSPTSENSAIKPNLENNIQLAKIPSGNSTRPSPPDKYKIRKLKIDKVQYYSCLYCNKHFESIHYLNNHHRRSHPLVSCGVCNKMYDTLNSLIRHSYMHLSGNYQCDKCPELFHFKSELESHKTSKQM